MRLGGDIKDANEVNHIPQPANTFVFKREVGRVSARGSETYAFKRQLI